MIDPTAVRSLVHNYLLPKNRYFSIFTQLHGVHALGPVGRVWTVAVEKFLSLIKIPSLFELVKQIENQSLKWPIK